VGECINRIDICENPLCNLYVDYIDYGKQGFEKEGGIWFTNKEA